METKITILLFAYEIIVRITPTRKNYSILDNGKNFMWKFHDLIDKICPNVKKG